MAPSTPNTPSLDRLVQSLVPRGIPASKLRRLRDTFARQVKYHNFGRTNQFEIAEKLDGLQEKFRVLNHDELADALHARRVELRDREDKWLPELLDLVLRLSNDPANKTRIDEFKKVEPRARTPPPLRWDEVEADDPIDRNDPIWQTQDYSDLSSDEDGFLASSEATSPTSPSKAYRQSKVQPEVPTNLWLEEPSNPEIRERFKGTQFRLGKNEGGIVVTELQLIGELFSMVQGLPTDLFKRSGMRVDLQPDFRLSHASPHILEELISEIAQITEHIQIVRLWLTKPQSFQFLQKMRDCVQQILFEFDEKMSDVQKDILYQEGTSIISILATSESISEQSSAAVCVALFLAKAASVGSASPGGYMDLLYESVCQSQAVCDPAAFSTLSRLFCEVFEIYFKSATSWVEDGTLSDNTDPFFIVSTGDRHSLANLWEEWYGLDTTTVATNPPSFLKPFLRTIFDCGKTMVFLKRLQGLADMEEKFGKRLLPQDIHRVLATNDGTLPFSEVFSDALKQSTESCLLITSSALKDQLASKCGLWRTLDALHQIYFSRNGAVTDLIDSKLFGAIDQCKSAWNDRFLVSDLLQNVYESIDTIDPGHTVVHSTSTSSRAIESRRQSVKMLGDLSIVYRLPWPTANIISETALASYRRVALILSQIRRARYALDRRAHFHVHNPRLGCGEAEQKARQAVLQQLLLFVDTIYDHLTTLVIDVLDREMRQALNGAADVSSMIKVHQSYLAKLEKACLTAKKLVPIKDAILAILDLCIRFSDMVSAPALTDKRKNSDFEASSFISAASRHRQRQQRRQNGGEENFSSEDENDEDSENEEGYSTFILPEDTTTLEEIKKTGMQLHRQLSFIVAGLRSMARAGEQGTSWGVLAARLDWRQQAKNAR